MSNECALKHVLPKSQRKGSWSSFALDKRPSDWLCKLHGRIPKIWISHTNKRYFLLYKYLSAYINFYASQPTGYLNSNIHSIWMSFTFVGHLLCNIGYCLCWSFLFNCQLVLPCPIIGIPMNMVIRYLSDTIAWPRFVCIVLSSTIYRQIVDYKTGPRS